MTTLNFSLVVFHAFLLDCDYQASASNSKGKTSVLPIADVELKNANIFFLQMQVWCLFWFNPPPRSVNFGKMGKGVSGGFLIVFNTGGVPLFFN